MDRVEDLIKELKSLLDDSPEIKEYLRLKELLENDEELKVMRQEIARLTNENKKEEHDNLLERYNAHPLVSNYLASREEVINLLREIKTILSD